MKPAAGERARPSSGWIVLSVTILCALVLAVVQIQDLWPKPRVDNLQPSNDAMGGWPNYGNDPGGSRFSPLTQIDRTNVRALREVWRYSTGDWTEAQKSGTEFAHNLQVTPILVGDKLIGCSRRHIVFALDPRTGKQLWAFDPQFRGMGPAGNAQLRCKGVAAWTDSNTPPQAPCHTRIIMGGALRVFALDARTGTRCPGFGRNGGVGLRLDGLEYPSEVQLRGPPAIAGGVAAFGSAEADAARVNSPSGAIRAFDLRTGELRWTFDPVPRDNADPAASTWGKGSNTYVGSANAWSLLSADPELNMIYVPTTSPAADYFGGHRPGENRYANSLVALDATTGKVVWHFQVSHHDLWDYDLPAQPILTDIVRGGDRIPAVIQLTKQGFVFIFDRRNGRPIFPVKERPVPQNSDVPGEWLSPTQPFPSVIPPLIRQGMRPEDAWGFTPFDRNACRRRIAALTNGPLYTPPTRKGSVMMPATPGGMNWSGGAIDKRRNLLITPVLQMAGVVQLVPRERKIEANSIAGEFGGSEISYIFPMVGTPYQANTRFLTSPLGAPCSPPPWAKLVAVDLGTGKIRWDVPLGTIENFSPIPIPLKLGVPFSGGPIVTASGLIFMAGTSDTKIRAFDADTGKVLWRARLPASGMATPMTYSIGGRQFLVIAAGGNNVFAGPKGDNLVAFAL